MATTERKLMAATPVTFIDVYRIHAQDARELADMKLRLIGIKLYIHEAAPLIRWSIADLAEMITKQPLIRTQNYVVAIHGHEMSREVAKFTQREDGDQGDQ
jgi:phenylacetate-coenzyme A ligase PaaK-like adenylate-forming protein